MPVSLSMSISCRHFSHVIYFAYEVAYNTRFRRLLEIDLVSGQRKYLDARSTDEEGFEVEVATETAVLKLPLWRRALRNFLTVL